MLRRTDKNTQRHIEWHTETAKQRCGQVSADGQLETTEKVNGGLLHVAKEEGRTLAQISRASGIPTATINRYHHLLSRRYGRKSHGLIHGYRSMQDSRRLQVVLTPDGHQFFQRLVGGDAEQI